MTRRLYTNTRFHFDPPASRDNHIYTKETSYDTENTR
jgi:hypothetical protein